MYETFFRLQSRPFPASPTVANYFPSQGIELSRLALLRSIERLEGPGLIVGSAGVGKSLLLRVVAEYFAKSFQIVLLSGTRVTTRRALLQNILFEMNLPYRDLDEGELRLSFMDALRPGEPFPNGILLLIDEAHTLPLRLLDETRLITNVVRDGQPRVRLVLAGNPQLDERFANPKLESFNQRIAARCYLQAFSYDETFQFVRAEIAWAGGDPDAIISHDAIQAVFRATDGIPRLVNQVCDHAMVMAHAAGQSRLEAATIQEAWADMQQLPPTWQARPRETNSDSTVIEFGSLDEKVEGAFTELPVLDGARHEDGCIAQNDSPHAESLSVDDLVHSDSLIISTTENVEWLTGETPNEDLRIVPVAANPFSEEFDEEVVVLDRRTAFGLEAFRGRPRVSCAEGSELSAMLAQAGVTANPRVEPAPRQTAGLPTEYNSGFEFTTFQDLPSPTSPSEHELDIDSVHTDGQVDLDFEDDIDCVPLPWTRGTLGDDRDLIIVEEDAPHVALRDNDLPEQRPRRVEYREIFAQLRRAST